MTTVVVVVLLVVLLVAALRLWVTANRLDRLHVRTEAAWAALDGALSRRIVATRAAAAAGAFAGPDVDRLRQLTREADRADRRSRADAENDLSRALATQPPVVEPQLAAELLDAGERVALARSFYNDAVRDTRALRAVWFTRLFRLAGRAVLPDYFEIADQLAGGAAPRLTARVLLLDREQRVLLFSGTGPHGARIWFATGGGVQPGEDLRSAAVRELAEETGLRLSAGEMIGPIWRRTARFVFTGVDHELTEFYFIACAPAGFQVSSGIDAAGLDAAGLDAAGLDAAGLDAAGFDAAGAGKTSGYRWFTRVDLGASTETIYPVELARRFAEVQRWSTAGQASAAVLEIT